MDTRKCLNCGDTLKGRSDKKFCDDQCRTSFNNHLNIDASVVLKSINSILKKNRKILHELLSSATDGKIKVSEKKLHDRSFNFNYHTNIYKTRTGAVYYFCYEYGYLLLENNFYMLVKRNGD
jgi:hypothetical protein